MKLRTAVKYVALSACVAVPGAALAQLNTNQGTIGDDLGNCQELISDGAFAQYRCGDHFVQTLGQGVNALTAVSAVGGDGLAHQDTAGPGTFQLNTGDFAFTDNSGAASMSDAAFDTNMSIQQSVNLGSVSPGSPTGSPNATLSFQLNEGPDAADGFGRQVAFFQRMNDPDASGARYAPDTRFQDMTSNDTDARQRSLDISAGDSRLHFRLQQHLELDDTGAVVADNELLRFGQNRLDGSFAHFFAYAELNGDGGHLLTPVNAGSPDVPGTGGQSRHDGLVDNWVAAIEGDGGDLTGVEDMFFDFRSDEFFHNDYYILADGSGGVLNPDPGLTTQADTTGLAFGEEVNNANYAGPFQAGSTGESGIQ